MSKRIFRAFATVIAVALVSSVSTGCTTVNPRLRSDTGYGSTTIPTEHSEAVRVNQAGSNEVKKRKKMTPEERRALVEHYKEVMSDI